MTLLGVPGCPSRLFVRPVGVFRGQVGGARAVGDKVGTGATVVKAGSRMVNEGSQGRRHGDLGDESEDAALRHKRNGTAEGYREAAMRTGWTCPGAGLFEPDDPVLSGKSKGGKYRPFAKHLPNAMSPYEPVETGGFISGREAVEERGIDLRLLWDCEGEKVVGVVRFDEAKAAIGPGYSVHGGAIQAVLDEATAEAGKMSAFPYLATRRIAHEIKKPVPCGTTLEVWTEVREIKGLRCFVAGEIRDPSAGTVYASAEAELVNMVPFLDRE